MNVDVQDVLLDLFHQVSEDPDSLPAVPVDAWHKDSKERRLLASFRAMLAHIQQSRQDVEQQLREKEAQYRSIFEAATDALLINDLKDAHVVEVNPAACKMYGYTYEELIGLPATATTHPDSLYLVAEALRTIQAGEQIDTQGVALRKDGTSFYAEAHGTPFTYKGKPHILGIVRDVTERVQAQQLLEQRVEERTRELSTLLEVSHNVASTLELEPLLGMILDQLKTVVDYSGASINTLEGEDVVIVDYRGFRPQEYMLCLRFPLKQAGLIWEMIGHREPVIIDDVQDDTPLARAYREMVGELLETSTDQLRSWMAVPLALKDQVIGMLALAAKEPHYFTQRHIVLALAVANQAAVAIENARLYEQAQDVAVLEERQRLARELHDSVSQALYGISLGAHTARTMLERDPGQVAGPLDYVLSLAEVALAEMRALIYELRPESLKIEGLVSALAKQAAAVHARHGITISTDLCDEPDLPLKAKQDLYRIAQEALHNTVKHAHASKVDLRLQQAPGALVLEVYDDGIGFDPTGSFPGHLGLHSMRERVTSLGGMLSIESLPGKAPVSALTSQAISQVRIANQHKK
jgi:PAS domain S-box-containing protein